MVEADTHEADLFAWQDKAVDAWLSARGRGIVLGMTGTGKTHVAIKALHHLLERGERVSPLIVVPTTALLDQWYQKLKEEFPGRTFGRIGNGFSDTFARCAEGALPFGLISTVHSAVPAVENGLFAHCQSGGDRSLVIADECHRYANEDQLLFNRLLRGHYDYILGLSATVEQYEIPGIGQVVYEYDIVTAVRDGVIPPFTVVNIGVEFSKEEVAKYLELSQRLRDANNEIESAYPELKVLEGNRRWAFIKRLQDEGNLAAKRLLSATYKRAALVHEASAKLRLIPKLIDLLVSKGHRKALVFFERIWTADESQDDTQLRVVNRIRAGLTGNDRGAAGPIWCEVYHSQVNRVNRAATLDRFKSVGPSALLACRSLDEGLDVPAVDVGILVASTQSPRQRLQRIGRTLRRGDGRKKPIIVIIYVRGTTDDSVSIQADDHEFAGAVSVVNASAETAEHELSRLLGLVEDPVTRGTAAAGVKPVKVTATMSVTATPDPYAGFLWRNVVKGRSTPVALAEELRRLRRGAIVRVTLKNGKTLTGTFRAVLGGDLLLRDPMNSVSLQMIAVAWVGRRQP